MVIQVSGHGGREFRWIYGSMTGLAWLTEKSGFPMILRPLALMSLAWASAVSAATYTVGAGGTHADIQSAIDAALPAPGNPGMDEIRIAAGTFTENLVIEAFGSGNELHISGGWNASFTTMGDQPTTIDGNASGRVVDVYMLSGDSLTLTNLRFQNGLERTNVGVLANLESDARLEISDCEIMNNIAEDARGSAAGLGVWTYNSSEFTLIESLISGNQVNCSGDVDCREGGMSLNLLDSSVGTVKRNRFIDNSVTIASGSAFSGGALIYAYDTSTLTVEDNEFIGNTIAGTSSAGFGTGLGVAGTGTKTLRRNFFQGNNATLPDLQIIPQFSHSHNGSGTDILSDSVVVDSSGRGVAVSVGGTGGPTVHIVNLTIADNAGDGIRVSDFSDGSTLTVSNSISVDNGLDNAALAAGVVSTSNLFGGVAGFVNAAAGDYSLLSTSSAVNAGTNAPPGGLGPVDIAGSARVSQGTVDQGAYEFQSGVLFSDGFEAGGLSEE